MCEKSLINNVKLHKDEESFKLLIDPHKTQLLGFIQSKTFNSRLDANEIFNIVLMKIWSNINSFREESSFRTWIFQISKNTIYDEFNKENRHQSKAQSIETSELELIDEKTPDSEIIEQEYQIELSQRIEQIKSKLGEKHREIFELVFERGLSYAEASKELGCPIGTVMSRVFYTKKQVERIIV